MDKATQKSIEWQKANNPMAIGGDAFVDMVDSFNVNPAFVAGYKEAEKDLALTWEDIGFVHACLEDIFKETAKGQHDEWTVQDIYKEALRRFNEQREKK